MTKNALPATLSPVYDQGDGTYEASPPPSGGSWQLASGYFAPAVMPLTLVRPAAAANVVGFYCADYYGYVGRQAEVRITLQGGAWPYIFEIVSAPTGATISNDPTDKENYGVLKFTPGANGSSSISINVTDQAGTSLNIAWTFTTSTDWAVFISPTGNNTTGTGTKANPWQTIDHAFNVVTGGKALILEDGTYTVTNTGKSTGNAWINSILGWGNGAIIDLVSNTSTTPGQLFYINSNNFIVQRITIRNPQNLVNNPRLFSSQSSTNDCHMDDVTIEVNGRSGTANDDNVSCWFFGGSNQQRISQTRCNFSGFVGLSNGWSAVDFYGTRYATIEANTFADQVTANNSGAGMLWVKGTANRDIDVRNNEFTDVFAGSLIEAYQGNDSANDVTGNVDISYNLIRGNGGSTGIWVGRSDNVGSRLPVWSRRNTLVNAAIIIFNRTYAYSFFSDRDVIQTSSSSSDPWKVLIKDANDPENTYRPLSNMSSLTASVTNYECHGNSGIVDSNGNLQGAYLANYNGRRGHKLVYV
jgi:hypothetical protein